MDSLVDFSSGQMRTVAVFYSNEPVANDSGGRDDNWVQVTSTRARLRQDRGKKTNEQGQIIFNKDFQLVCRFKRDITPDAKWKVKIDGEDYRIINFVLYNEIKRWFIFSLSKITR